MRAATALMAERLIGWPDALDRCVGHPVVWVGAALSVLERRWNRPSTGPAGRRVLGVAALLLPTGAAALAGGAAQALARRIPFAPISLAMLAIPGLAQRSLYDHVRAVLHPLQTGELSAARRALARIVGRDTADLDVAGVARAALETLAESFNDGVVAPAFWLAVAGLPGLYAYKAVNTADSMIGHREPRWRAFGWAAARLDDAMNLAPARLAGGLIALAGGGGWRTMRRDARRHASPNAGWPEAAMAGALGVRLGGPAIYDGVETMRPWLGDGPPPGVDDLSAGLELYARACTLLVVGVAAAELAGALARRRAR